MPMSEKINLCQVQGPCRAGTQRLAAQRRTRRDRAAGRPRLLPPARHCSPGKPRPHTGHLLFLQQGAFGGKYVPAGLGHFPLRGPWPRLWPGSCSGRAAMVRASAWAAVQASVAWLVARGWIREGHAGVAAQAPHTAGSRQPQGSLGTGRRYRRAIFWRPQHLGGKDEVGLTSRSTGCAGEGMFRAGDRPQSCCPDAALSWPREQHSSVPSMGPSTGTSVTKAPAVGLETALPHLLPSWPRRSRSPQIHATRCGPRYALAPCWCLALMLSKAYLLLGFYLHPLSLSARGSPPACATFPERACSRCGQHYCLPNAAACPQSLTPGPAPIMRVRRGLWR